MPAPARSPLNSTTAFPSSLPSDSAPTERVSQQPSAHLPLPPTHTSQLQPNPTNLAFSNPHLGRAFDPSEEATAELLLNLSTSPELRPIIFD